MPSGVVLNRSRGLRAAGQHDARASADAFMGNCRNSANKRRVSSWVCTPPIAPVASLPKRRNDRAPRADHLALAHNRRWGRWHPAFPARLVQGTTASAQRPKHGWRQPAGGSEDPVVEQAGATLGKGFDFLGTQQLRQPPPQLTVEPVENPDDAVPLLLAQRLAQPSSQRRAQLALHMEGQPVVHAVAVPAGHGEDEGNLAVGAVDDHVEHRHAAQRRHVSVGQDQPIPVLVLTLLTV